jgi:putative nucleotidyltransferase with HDIG domain
MPPGACPLWVASSLIGSTRGEIRCRIDAPLAIAIAEGMWGESVEVLQGDQTQDAVRELCGQIIGYAAGEVSARFPGVLFEPPRSFVPAAPEPDPGLGPGGDCAVVPTRAGALRWEVREISVPQEVMVQPLHLTALRERIRSLRDTDLQLLQAVRVLGIDENAEDAFEQLIKTVGTDPALTARILRRVNSAPVRPRGARIQTLPQAILYLGMRAAKNIVMSSLLVQPVGPPQPAHRTIVAHSLQVALLSRQLAPLIGLDGDESYLLGLLHDLGRLVLERLYPAEVAALAGFGEDALLAQEVQSLGITHAEAGAIIAMAWHFPDMIRLVMTLHHDAALLDHLELQPRQRLSLHLVVQADRLADLLVQRGLVVALQACAEAAKVLGLEPAALMQGLESSIAQLKEDLINDAV